MSSPNFFPLETDLFEHSPDVLIMPSKHTHNSSTVLGVKELASKNTMVVFRQNPEVMGHTDVSYVSFPLILSAGAHTVIKFRYLTTTKNILMIDLVDPTDKLIMNSYHELEKADGLLFSKVVLSFKLTRESSRISFNVIGHNDFPSGTPLEQSAVYMTDFVIKTNVVCIGDTDRVRALNPDTLEAEDIPITKIYPNKSHVYVHEARAFVPVIGHYKTIVNHSRCCERSVNTSMGKMMKYVDGTDPTLADVYYHVLVLKSHYCILINGKPCPTYGLAEWTGYCSKYKPLVMEHM
jgi:hypothetical protein